MINRRIAITAGLAFLYLSDVPALAKGTIPPRGYVVVDGPGLAHPIGFSAPWDPSRTGAYYGEEAEVFLNLVGAFADVTPVAHPPPAPRLGPAYSVSFFLLDLGREGSDPTVRQVIFPHATGGPLVFTPPGQDRSFPAVFGRYWTRPPTVLGRASADSMDLLKGWGLPAMAPSAMPQALRPAQSSAAVDRSAEAGSRPWRGMGGALGLGLLLGAVLGHRAWPSGSY